MWETCTYRNKFIVEWHLGEPISSTNLTIWNNFYKGLLNSVQNWKFIKVILKIPMEFDENDYGDVVAAIKRCERINAIVMQTNERFFKVELLKSHSERFLKRHSKSELLDIETKEYENPKEIKDCRMCSASFDNVYIDKLGYLYLSSCKKFRNMPLVNLVTTEIERLPHGISFCKVKECDFKYKSIRPKPEKKGQTKQFLKYFDIGIDKFDEKGNMNYRYVKWRLFNMCNYDCWYCIRAKSCRDKDPNFEVLSKRAKTISEMMHFYNDLYSITLKEKPIPYRVGLTGGEVTILPVDKIVSLVDSLNSYGELKEVFITTNFFRDETYFLELSNLLKERGIQLDMNVSLHETETDFDTFINKLINVTKNEYVKNISVEFVINDKNQKMYKKLRDTVYSLRKQNLNITFSPDYMRDDKGNKLTKEILKGYKYKKILRKDLFLKTIKNKKGDLVLSKINHNQNFGAKTCVATCQSLTNYIDSDGLFYKRICAFKTSIASIDDEDFIDKIKEDPLKFEYIACPNVSCRYASEIIVDL